jgi:hypothetical protein
MGGRFTALCAAKTDPLPGPHWRHLEGAWGGVSGSQPKGWAQPRSALQVLAGSPTRPERARLSHSSTFLLERSSSENMRF